MKNGTRILAASALGIAAASAGAAAEATYKIDGFDRVDVSEGLSAIIVMGDQFEIRAEADRQKTLEDLDIERRGDTLYIKRTRKWSGLSFFQTRRAATIYITMPDLDGVDASSGASLSARGVASDRFDGSASSGATITLEELNANHIWLDASSGATVRAEGKCKEMGADASSGATIRADRLECVEVRVDASSGASMRVHGDLIVTAEASSGASIHVTGKPEEVVKETSSGGSVRVD